MLKTIDFEFNKIWHLPFYNDLNLQITELADDDDDQLIYLRRTNPS